MRKYIEQVSLGTWISWGVLTAPLIWLTYEVLVQRFGGGQVFYWSGVFSVWLMLATLAVSPIVRLFRGATWNRWLIIGRRHMGVAAFGYGLVHTVVWAVRKPLDEVLLSIFRQVTLVGWIALAIFIVMAVTSNDWSVRRMGPTWKKVQRWIYLGAPLVILHWLMSVGYRAEKIAIYIAILTILMGYRIWDRQTRKRRAGRD